MAEKKWQISVYSIHQLSKATKEVYQVLSTDEKDYAFKNRIILTKLLGVDGRKYISQKLVDSTRGVFELFLYYRIHPKPKPQWKDFFSNYVMEEEKIHEDLKNKNESFVLFLYHKEKKKLYVVSGGYGFFVIDKHIESDFGIELLSRIVKNKGDKILQSAKEIGLTSGIAGTFKVFREEYNFHENRNFGNVYQEILASMDKDILRELGIPSNEVKKCLVKNSFKLNQSLTFSEMINLVKSLDKLMEKEPKITVNDIKKIDPKRNSEVIKKLEREILDKLWKKKLDKEWLANNIDLRHKNFEKYVLADNYKFSGEVYDSNYLLLNKIIEKFENVNKKDFIKKLKTNSLRTSDSEDINLTDDTIFNHFIYEFIVDTKSYFLINGKYYEITNDFKGILNESCKNFINENYDNGLAKKWGNTTEGVYNLSYKGDNKTIVLDTITPENIEPCDILKYDDEHVYFYHVKKGFNGSMRDLTNQVLLAASRIQEDKRSDFKYLTSVYEKMQISDTYKGQVNTLEEFIKIVKKKPIFILAVKDDSTKNRYLKNIEEFASNIAKFSLNELVGNMRTLGVDFRITQIKR